MSEQPPPWGETPGPWTTPSQQPGPVPQPGWGTPPPAQPPGRPPTPYGQPVWGNYTPPSGWTPPPVERMKKRQIFAGIGACFLLNIFAFYVLARALGGATSLITLALNVGVIVLAAVKGYKGFAVGFALGYVVAFVLLLGACFLLLAGAGGGWG